MRLRGFHKVLYIAIIMGVFCPVSHSWGVFEKGPYLQNVGKSHITIMWETLYTSRSRVEYGVTKDCDLFVEEPKEAYLHEVTLRPLRPNTLYYYKVTSGFSTRTGTFRTSPNHNLPVEFVVYGDSRNDPDIHRKIAEGILKAKPDLILHVGDLVNNGKMDYQWGSQFFEPLEDVINHIPIFPALGNHENNARNYFDFFSLPNNELWYSFNYSNCHFTVLDTNKEYEKGSKQYRWLRNDLKAAKTEWKFVFFHHPPYGSGIHHGSTLKARDELTPLFRRYGVDIVFCGHHHIYERSYPIDSAFESKSSPVTYVVTGGGGGPLQKTSPNIWTVLTESINHFCVVSIDGEELKFKALDADGRVLDKLSITKNGKYQQYTKSKIYYEQIEFESTLQDNIIPPVVILDKGGKMVQDAVKVKNTFPNAVDFKIVWHHLNNWDVKPKQAVVRIGSKKAERIPFTFYPPDMGIWPPPMFSLVYDTGLNSGKITGNYLRVSPFRQLSCSEAGKSLDLDGQLKERFWGDAELASEFIRKDFSGLAENQTTAKAARGKNEIYLAIVCKEPETEKLIASVDQRDGNIRNDEAVIVSIAPHRGYGIVYQFGVNCEGVQYDAKDGVKEWNGKWESATRINDADWTVEMAIPYTVLEMSSSPKKGESWRINFFRSTKGAPEKSEWLAATNSPLKAEGLGILIMK